jgi:hypothetical protein
LIPSFAICVYVYINMDIYIYIHTNIYITVHSFKMILRRRKKVIDNLLIGLISAPNPTFGLQGVNEQLSVRQTYALALLAFPISEIQ